MPPKHPLKAPSPSANKAEHKKHVKEFLEIEQYKDPKKVNGPEYRDMTDEAKP